MNTQSVGLRTFVAAAIAVALSYLLALRFGSWWWTLSALPIGILLYDPTHSLQTCKNLAKKPFAQGKFFPSVVGKDPDFAILQNTIIESVQGCFVIARYMIAYGLGLLAVCWALIAFGGNGFLTNYDIGTFVFSLLVFGFVGLLMSLAIRSGPDESKKRPDWPIIRKLSNWFPLPKDWTWEFSGKTFASNLKKQGVLADSDGDHFKLSRFILLLIDTVRRFWSVIWFTLRCAGYALTLPISMGIILVDSILSLLFAITTHASVGAGIGGFSGALLEYLYYPHMETTSGDILRFVLFMAIGGALGVGLYKLREWASREEVKPVVVPDRLY